QDQGHASEGSPEPIHWDRSAAAGRIDDGDGVSAPVIQNYKVPEFPIQNGSRRKVAHVFDFSPDAAAPQSICACDAKKAHRICPPTTDSDAVPDFIQRNVFAVVT